MGYGEGESKQVPAPWKWIPRKANRAADAAALEAKRKMCDEVWISRPPSSLVFVLHNDGLPCPPQV
ncbi:unnamed protein product [Prunus armeniaca]